jgi:hypothetical protein
MATKATVTVVAMDTFVLMGRLAAMGRCLRAAI